MNKTKCEVAATESGMTSEGDGALTMAIYLSDGAATRHSNRKVGSSIGASCALAPATPAACMRWLSAARSPVRPSVCLFVRRAVVARPC